MKVDLIRNPFLADSDESWALMVFPEHRLSGHPIIESLYYTSQTLFTEIEFRRLVARIRAEHPTRDIEHVHLIHGPALDGKLLGILDGT